MNENKNYIEFSTDMISVKFDDKGNIPAILSKMTNENLVIKDNERSLISLYIENKIILPVSFEADQNELLYFFPDDISVKILVEAKNHYINFVVKDLINPNKMKIIYLFWGPFSINIKNTIADTLGVVYDDNFAIGLLGLNVKTVASFPKDVQEIYGIDDWTDIRFPEYYSAAIPVKNGGVLRAFTADYTEDRYINYKGLYNFNYDDLIVPKLEKEICGRDGDIVGSKIAIYGCKTNEVLNIVGEIEVAEGLPHPVNTDGVWQKDTEKRYDMQMRTDYLFRFFTKDTILNKIQDARRLNALFLYGHDTFRTYNGDYRFIGFKDYNDFCVNISDRAKQYGLYTGTKNRPAYIQKDVPDAQGTENIIKYFSFSRELVLKTDIDEDSVGRKIEFDNLQIKNADINEPGYILIDNNELMQVQLDSMDSIIVERGIQGTEAHPHKAGAKAKLLKFVPYYEGVFVGNQKFIHKSMIEIADTVNKGGMTLSDMDGLELSELTGHDIYMFNKTMDWWYNSLNCKKGIKSYASGMTQWVWHICTAQTWGEKYLPFTDRSEYDYRLKKNYDYYVRNFYPVTTGLCGINQNFTELDVQNLGSKAAAFATQLNIADEGFSKTENKDRFLDILREWTSARDMNAIPLETRKKIAPFNARYSIEVKEPMIEWELTNFINIDGKWKTGEKEIVAAPGIINLMHNKGVKIISKSSENNLSLLIDKKLDTCVNIGKDIQCVLIDLGNEEIIDQIRIWHDFEDGRIYRDVIIEISNNENYDNSEIIFNNDNDNSLNLGFGKDSEYSESYVGKTITCNAKKARYIRIWSNGNSTDSFNRYAEIQVISGKRTYPMPIKREDRLYDI